MARGAGLKIERGVFTRGRSPYRYLDALRANLFLSANEQDVMGAPVEIGNKHFVRAAGIQRHRQAAGASNRDAARGSCQKY